MTAGISRTWPWLAGAVFLMAACAPGAAPKPPAPSPPAEEPAPPPRPGVPVGEPAEASEVVPATPEPEPEPAAMPEPAADPEAVALAAALERVERPGLRVLPGAVLPRERIVAFYGNPGSARMGILGEVPPDEMLSRLDTKVAQWRAADPSTPVRPALHLIAVMAAADPGPDSTYRIRQPARRIEEVMAWAERRNALVFLDIQPGRSTVAAELPRLERWLREPHVHLALDPEWAMGPDEVPGQRIGTMGADEVNQAVDFLARVVDEHGLPPKVLVVHRFTQGMLRDAARIRTDPRVQVVIHMDGWGPPAQKIQSYRQFVVPEAEQFTGFKLFFHHDQRPGSRMLTPSEILELAPPPIYIQYQ